MLNKYSILGGIVLASLVSGTKVQAEGNCPDGYFPIGGQGVQGCAPIPVQQQPRSNPGSGSGRSKPIPPRPKAPLKELSLQEAVDRIETSPTDKAEFETLYGKILFNEPRKGLWVMKSKGGGTAKQCGATFFDRPSLANGLVLLGPNQVGKGAMVFQGAKLPKTDREKQIQPVLTFKGQQPGTVNAALIPSGSASRVLVLTDMVSLMRAAKGSSEVSLQLDGKEVFRSEVHGLTEVGSAMLECMGVK